MRTIHSLALTRSTFQYAALFLGVRTNTGSNMIRIVGDFVQLVQYSDTDWYSSSLNDEIYVLFYIRDCIDIDINFITVLCQTLVVWHYDSRFEAAYIDVDIWGNTSLTYSKTQDLVSFRLNPFGIWKTKLCHVGYK